MFAFCHVCQQYNSNCCFQLVPRGGLTEWLYNQPFLALLAKYKKSSSDRTSHDIHLFNFACKLNFTKFLNHIQVMFEFLESLHIKQLSYWSCIDECHALFRSISDFKMAAMLKFLLSLLIQTDKKCRHETKCNLLGWVCSCV